MNHARAHANAPRSSATRVTTAAATALLLSFLMVSVVGSQPAPDRPPPTLHNTGLYTGATLDVDAGHLAFSPQYPLWTDGATKRRWISIPPGTAIDASDPNAWVFPVGTRLWKEFSFGDVRVETRFIERRADGQWLYAAYAWRSDGAGADLVPESGRRNAHPFAGGRSYSIPGTNDCKACHEGGRSQVLGFSALQLSPDRDPHALHAEIIPATNIDLFKLVERGLVVGLPAALQRTAPRIAAASPTERTALGYLHGNCGHCHNAQGPLRNVGLVLRQSVGAAGQPVMTTTIRQPVQERAPGQSVDAVVRIDPEHPERSALMQRLASRYPALQMPPLGTVLPDKEAIEVIRQWIAEIDNHPHTPQKQKGS
jgi:hypothetical protein